MSDYPKRPVAVVTLSTGETVSIRPFTAEHFILSDEVPDALEAVGAFIRKALSTTNAGSEAFGPEALLSRECRRPVIALLRAAVKNPDAWWAQLELEDLTALIAGVVEVNYAHSGKKLTASAAKLFGMVATPTA